MELSEDPSIFGFVVETRQNSSKSQVPEDQGGGGVTSGIDPAGAKFTSSDTGSWQNVAILRSLRKIASQAKFFADKDKIS